jgi:uncharacterized membrane protein
LLLSAQAFADQFLAHFRNGTVERHIYRQLRPKILHPCVVLARYGVGVRFKVKRRHHQRCAIAAVAGAEMLPAWCAVVVELDALICVVARGLGPGR